MTKSSIAWSVALALLVPSLASAQSGRVVGGNGWLEDRQRAEGPGFRIGNLELHPGFGAEVGYDTNVFLEDESPQGDGIMRLTAHLLVSTLGAQRRNEGEGSSTNDNVGRRKLAFRGGASASYYHYFRTRARNNLEADASFSLTINPDGVFAFRVYNEFNRSIRPFTEPSTGGRAPTFARDRNLAGAEIQLQSRGRIITGSLGYEANLDWFEDDVFDYGNSITHRIRLTVNWRFLPSTAIIHETQVNFQNYIRETDGPATLVGDNRTVTSRVGVNGAIGRTFAITAMAGYTAGFQQNANLDEYQSIDAHLEGRWTPRGSSSFSFGYRRRFRPSFLGSFAKLDTIYLRFRMIAAGSFLIGASGSVSFDKTGSGLAPDGVTLAGNQDERSDIRLRLSLFAEYRITDWLGINATLGYLSSFTDYEWIAGSGGGGAGSLLDPPSAFSKFDAFLGVRAFY